MRFTQLVLRLKKVLLQVVVLHWYVLQSALDGLTGANDDQNVGINILRRAIEAPLRQIVANAGDEPSVVINAVKNGEGNYGYNAATGRIWRHVGNGYS